MEIRTKRLLLSPLGPQYVNTAFAYSGDLENTKFMLDLPEESIEETAEFLKKAEAEWQKEFPEFYEFAILTEGTHIGSVCFYPGNILPLCTDTGFGSGQTDLQRIVQKEYSITVF